MKTYTKLLLIKDAIEDFDKGNLSEDAALFAITLITSPRQPTKEDIERVHELVEAHPEWK